MWSVLVRDEPLWETDPLWGGQKKLFCGGDLTLLSALYLSLHKLLYNRSSGSMGRCGWYVHLWPRRRADDGSGKEWLERSENKELEMAWEPGEYSWPLDNMGWNCMGLGIRRFFSVVNTTVLHSLLLAESVDMEGWLSVTCGFSTVPLTPVLVRVLGWVIQVLCK